MDYKSKAASYFKNYPKVDVFHFTSDGMAFYEKTHAESHAMSLEDIAVQTITRKNANDGAATNEATAEAKAAETKAAEAKAAETKAAETKAAEKKPAGKKTAKKGIKAN